jgi:hypothetical protein
VVVGAAVGLALVSNLVATLFWQRTGGVGLLDLDGGANLLHPEAGRPLPPAGTAERTLAIVTAYTGGARVAHAVLLCTLDLVFPLALAAAGWTTIARAAGSWSPRWRTAALVAGAGLALAYLGADWGENVTELLLLAGRRGAAVTTLPHLSALKLQVFAVMALAMLAATGVSALGGARRRRRDRG